jgi:hypothetical protein
VSGEIVNLRRARKAKQRVTEAGKAAENRTRFGRSKAQRELEAAVETREQRLFEAHRREGSSPVESSVVRTDPVKDQSNGQ